MALSVIKKSTLPVLRGGPGKLSVALRANGQISFSGAATKALSGAKLAVIGFDEAKRVLQFQGVNGVPKGMAESDLFKLGQGKKSKTAFLSGAGLLTMLEYDYKASGNQNFDATADESKKIVSMVLPKGALKPNPVKHRTSKGKDGKGTKATPATPATQTEPEEEGEPELVEQES